jgi:hypothetical protein
MSQSQDEEKAQLELEREIASVQYAQVRSSQTLHSRGVEGIQVPSKDLPSLRHFVTGPCPYMTGKMLYKVNASMQHIKIKIIPFDCLICWFHCLLTI